ncbi:MAG: beta-N-acetylhexosaminidase [Zetaproteobacteria bacterium]|nr:MAG: beta-N-acetylhexosaminidase [Zetaproteobacteria bacterium]
MWERALIGLAGTRLSEAERRMIASRPPRGVILFSRNIETPAQLRALIDDVRDAAGEYLWAAIDEEGGGVRRIPWPPFDARPAAAVYGALWREDPDAAAARVRADAERVGEALAGLGITHNCMPVLDVRDADGHPVIGDRAYGEDPACVAQLGAAAIEGLHAAGVAAVGKHFPGHGRARADSHAARPVVEAPWAALKRDLAPFAAAIAAGVGHLMTAHVVYAAVDQEIATCSELWIRGILRTKLGFQGMVWSDDLAMTAVSPDPVRAAKKALAAGCDVLLACTPEAAARLYAAA